MSFPQCGHCCKPSERQRYTCIFSEYLTPSSLSARPDIETSLGETALLKAGTMAQSTVTPPPPLVQAAKYGRSAVCSELLKARASGNTCTPMRFSALHWAAGNGHTECVALLMAAKANSHIESSAGETPLQWAERNQQVLWSRLNLDGRVR